MLKSHSRKLLGLLSLLVAPLVAYGVLDYGTETIKAGRLNIDNLRLDGNTISTQNANGDLTFDMNGSGSVLFTDLTADTVPYLDASKQLTSSAVTPTELGYVSGVTSALQTQMNLKAPLASPTFTGTFTGPWSTAGPVITSSGGVLTSEATLATARGGTGAATLTGLSIPSLATDIVTFDGQAAAPSNPSAGFYKIYVDDTSGKPKVLNSAGAVSALGGSGGGAGINMLADYNPKAEDGTAFWTESGSGTFTTTSTAANVGNGLLAFSFDSAATADWTESTQINIPPALYGKNCLIEFHYKGFDSNINVWVEDNSGNDLVFTPLSAQTTYTRFRQNFVCPTTGQIIFRLYSLSGGSAIGYWDEVHLGSADNLSEYNGAIDYGTQAWTDNQANATTSVKLLRIGNRLFIDGLVTYTGVQAGDYTLTIPTEFTPGYSVAGATGPEMSSKLTLVDTGTGVQGGKFIWTATNTLTAYASNTSGTYINYSSLSSTVPHTWASGDFIRFNADWEVSGWTTTPAAALSSSLAGSWSGYHDTTCFFARTNTAFGDFAADATCAFTERLNKNMGSVTSKLSGSDKLPGLVFTPTQTGAYELCASVGVQGTGILNTTLSLRITNNAGTEVGTTHWQLDNASSTVKGTRICVQDNISSVGSTYTYTLEGAAGASAINVGGVAPGQAIEWTLKYIGSGSVNAPTLVGSVTSAYTGPLKIETANINCDAGSAITSQLGSWVASVGNISTGACAVTLAAGYAATPYCWVETTGAISTGLETSVTASSATAVSVDCETDASAECSSVDFNLFCIGAK